jgi:putative transposase
VREVMMKLSAMRLTKAAELVEAKAHKTPTYFAFPSNHWRQVKTNNPLERIIREIRRRTRVVGAFPDGHSALMLVAARLRQIASVRSGQAALPGDGNAAQPRFLRSESKYSNGRSVLGHSC